MTLVTWRRKFVSSLFVAFCAASVLLALVPLAFVLFFVVSQGIQSLNVAFFTHMPAPTGETGGGMANSPIRTPADLAGVAISVGYQSGSHYSTIQALEQYLPPDEIKLSFEEGMLFGRLELFLSGKSPAIALFNGPYYFAEQLGCRKIIDNTFMIAAMINGDPEPDDIRKYFRALRRAQRDIDLRPELYTHYYKNEFPELFHSKMDTRRWGPGERIVFETYSKEMFERSFDWIAKHAIFESGAMGSGNYEQAVISLAAE